MSIRTGIIGPRQSVDKIREAIAEHVMFIEPVDLSYESFPEAVDILRERQASLDCVLFSGSTPYRYVSHYLSAACPWEYLPQSQLSLVCSLLQAAYVRGWDIRRASFDSYEQKLVYSAYREAGYKREDTGLYFADFDLLDPDYIELLCRFHQQMHRSGKTSCCITGLEKVRACLESDGIPCIIINNATEIIVQQINKLRLDLQLRRADEARLAAVTVEIGEWNGQSAGSRDMLQAFYNRNSAGEQIYMYAQKLGAAIVELPGGCFRLFTTKAVIQNDTENFTRFDLLRQILSRDAAQKVFIGIGLGTDAWQSQRNADTARYHARQNGVSCIYVLQENENLTGPVSVTGEEADRPADDVLYRISERTGIGIRALSRLAGILRQYHVRDTTVRELANLYGVSMRSMNRIVLRLEQGGYLTAVGKESTARPGRPGRIVRINFRTV